jgi:hypothetical protein
VGTGGGGEVFLASGKGGGQEVMEDQIKKQVSPHLRALLYPMRPQGRKDRRPMVHAGSTHEVQVHTVFPQLVCYPGRIQAMHLSIGGNHWMWLEPTSGKHASPITPKINSKLSIARGA